MFLGSYLGDYRGELPTDRICIDTFIVAILGKLISNVGPVKIHGN